MDREIFVGIIRNIDSNNDVSVTALSGTGNASCSIASIAGIHCQPAINDRGLVVINEFGYGTFFFFFILPTDHSAANNLKYKAGDIAISGKNGGVHVTSGGDVVLSSGISKVNILKHKISFLSESVTWSSGGLNISAGISGKETAFGINAANGSGDIYMGISGGNVKSIVNIREGFEDSYIDEDYDKNVESHYQNILFAQENVGKPLLKYYRGSPIQGGTNSTFYDENIINDDGTYCRKIGFSTGSVKDAIESDLKSIDIKETHLGQIGFGKSVSYNSNSIHGASSELINKNIYTKTNTDVRDVGGVIKKGSFEQSLKEDIGNVKIIESNQTEKIHYFIGNKVGIIPGSAGWYDLYSGYDVDKGKYSSSKYLVSDNGVLINTSVEIWFDDTISVPRKLSVSGKTRIIRKAIVKWNTFGVSNEPKEQALPFVSREYDNEDLDKDKIVSSSNRSGYLRIEWGKGGSNNWLYKASGVSNRSSIKPDGTTETITRHIVNADKPFFIHDKYLKISVDKLEKIENGFIKKIRPDLSGRFNNKGLSAYDKLSKIVFFTQYVTQTKISGNNVETLRISNQSGKIDMFQETEQVPKPMGFGSTLKYNWDTWKYRNERLRGNTIFDTGQYGEFKEGTVSTVSVTHLAKLLHNMRESITVIGKLIELIKL